jgi:glycosyltransferase involved in cell wall biosynthesis
MSRRLRIAILAPLVAPLAEPFLGGSHAIVRDLATSLAGEGHAVTLFGADGSSAPGVEVVRLGIDAASLKPASFLEWTEPDPALEQRERAAFLRVAYEIRRRAGDFDVVHNHAFDAPPFELLDQVHPAVVHTLHLPPVISAVCRAAAAAASAGAVLVTVSRSAARSWHTVVGETRVIRNGVPLDRIGLGTARRSGWLFVGRIAPEKGLESALEAGEQAGRRLRVIGAAYDDAYHGRILERLRRHELLGPLPREAVFAEMARAEGLLMPAAWDEPFGLAAVEAMAAGTPVAAFAQGALPEIVEDQLTGFLVPPDDVAALRRSAERFQSIDPHACRARVEREFDLRRMVRDYLELYSEIA